MRSLLVTTITLGWLVTCVPNDARAEQAQTVKVKTSIRNNKGWVWCSLYASEDGFPNKFKQAKKMVKAKIKSKTAVCVFQDVPPGTYAVSAFHDENDNGEVDTNWIGMPKEGVGASNNAKGSMGPPSFDDAKFKVGATEVQQSIKLEYY